MAVDFLRKRLINRTPLRQYHTCKIKKNVHFLKLVKRKYKNQLICSEQVTLFSYLFRLFFLVCATLKTFDLSLKINVV